MTKEEIEEGRKLRERWDRYPSLGQRAWLDWCARHFDELLSLAEEARWMDVLESTPELMEEVLVYPNDANASSACAYLTEHGWRYGDFGGDCNPVPTHWRPLPKGLELAKEHVSFDDSAHVTGRLGEGRPNWEAAEEAVDKECG